MMVIEQAQMEQATVLRNFIATMETRNHPVGNGFPSGTVVRSSQEPSSLIDVSDNEINSKEEEYEETSDENAYETESESDTNSEYSTTDALENNIIKVINVEDLEDLNKTYMSHDQVEELHDGDDESVSTSCDDMFSTDLDKMELEKKIELVDSSEVDLNSLTQTAFVQSKDINSNTSSLTGNENIAQFDQMSILLSHEDFKGYTVSQIREYAVHRNIISKGDKKLKKKELVDYVIEANIEGGAEHLKVNKVGSSHEDDDYEKNDDVSSLIQETVKNSANMSESSNNLEELQDISKEGLSDSNNIVQETELEQLN